MVLPIPTLPAATTAPSNDVSQESDATNFAAQCLHKYQDDPDVGKENQQIYAGVSNFIHHHSFPDEAYNRSNDIPYQDRQRLSRDLVKRLWDAGERGRA